MTDRVKLITLIRHEVVQYFAERIADHLIANGVTFATDNNVGSKWIPVTERLPEKNKRVIACRKNNDGGYVFLAKFYRNDWFDMEWNVYRNCVTHWLPLPEKPKGD